MRYPISIDSFIYKYFYRWVEEMNVFTTEKYVLYTYNKVDENINILGTEYRLWLKNVTFY